MAPVIIQSMLLALIVATLAPCAAFVFVPGPAKYTLQRGGVATTARIMSNKAPPSRLRPPTALAGVRQVTAEELEKEMTEWDLPLILDVFAVWCGPCLMLKPELEKVADVLEGKCRVLKLDSDEHTDMASALNVYGLPTMMYMKDGELRHKTEGSMPADEILQLADLHFFGGVPPADPTDSLFIDTSTG